MKPHNFFKSLSTIVLLAVLAVGAVWLLSLPDDSHRQVETSEDIQHTGPIQLADSVEIRSQSTDSSLRHESSKQKNDETGVAGEEDQKDFEARVQAQIEGLALDYRVGGGSRPRPLTEPCLRVRTRLFN